MPHRRPIGDRHASAEVPYSSNEPTENQTSTSVRQNIQSLKYKMYTASGSKDICISLRKL